MRDSRIYILLIMALSVTMSCKRVPSYVIDPETMSQLMADMHVAESVVDLNNMDYRTDSSKIALRQAVLARHGVDAQQFDTSLVWYGHNIDKYIDVYDNTIKILQERDRALGNAIVQSSISMSGDSVDVWSGARYAVISRRMPSDMICFDLSSDENWEPGDVYTWRAKVLDDDIRSIRWSILANYTDSTCEWLNSTSSGMGWNEVVFATDSTKTLADIRGLFEVTLRTPDDKDRHNELRPYWIDSISLVRKRTNPEFYMQRSRLRRYDIYQ